MVLVRVLGPLAVEDDDSVLEVRGIRQRALLALLALHVGAVISNERIVDELWGDQAPANPTNAVQALVSRLRRVVGADVVARGAGYVLDVPADAVDATRFEQLIIRARADLDAGDAASAGSTAQEALALWKGTPLEGLGDVPFARAASVRLAELRGAAMDAWADAELALGRHDALIPELRAAVDHDPLRESGWARLMLALYRAGRQADALRAFQDARRILGDELGIEPGPELRALETAVLNQSPDLDAPQRASTSQAPAQPATPWSAEPRGQRRARTTFVGRGGDLDQLDRALASSQLVTLVGPGGVGKTRLATELAGRRADAGDRVAFVDLAPVVSEDDVADAVAMALGGRDQAALTGNALEALERAAVRVATGSVLVVLDNCEHVIDAAALAAETVIDASDRIHVIATSREALAVPGEHLHPLRPLAIAEAAELFVDRARAVDPTFDPGPQERELIDDVCLRLDALPLAIELAAARVRALPVAEIADRLDDRFRLLSAGARTVLPRQQTLRAVVDWSHELLGEEERHVLARLSVFVGGFALDDAASVVGGDKVAAPDVAGVVLRLVDKSLVTASTDGSNGPGRQARFGMLQTLWVFARERLAESGDEELLRERHADHFASLATELEPQVRARGQRSAMDRLEVEHDNLRAALEWAVETGAKELGARLVGDLGWFWYVRGYVSEGARWGEAVDALPGQIDVGIEARSLRWSILLALFTGRGDPVGVERAVALSRRSAEPATIGATLAVVSVAQVRAGDVDAAMASLDEAGRIGADVGDRWLQGTAALLRSGLLSGVHDVAEASRTATEAIEHFRVHGDDWGLSMALMTRANGLEAQGEYEAALADYSEAHEAAERLASEELAQHFLIHSGNLCTLAGDPAGARRKHEEAVAAARRIGSSPVLGMALNGLGLAARRLGDTESASAAHAEARELYRSGGWTAGEALALAGLGFAAEQAGDADAAARHHREGLVLAVQVGDERAVALACEGLAGAAALSGDHDGAGRLLGHAAARRDAVGAPLPRAERVDVDRIEAAVVESIGRERYETAFAAGAASDLDDLLAG